MGMWFDLDRFLRYGVGGTGEYELLGLWGSIDSRRMGVGNGRLLDIRIDGLRSFLVNTLEIDLDARAMLFLPRFYFLLDDIRRIILGVNHQFVVVRFIIFRNSGDDL